MRDKITVLSARVLQSENRSKFQERGINLQEHNFLNFSYRATSELYSRISDTRKPLILTSQHACLALQKMQHQQDNQGLRSKTAYCIAGRTQLLAGQIGIKVIASASNSLSLAKQIIKNEEDSLFYCTTETRLDHLESTLAAANVSLEIDIVYDKILKPMAMKDTDAILFFSPSQIEAYLMKNELLSRIPIFCIGPTTAKAARGLGYTNIIVSPQSTESSIVEECVLYYQNE